jgi:hypothetical protein
MITNRTKRPISLGDDLRVWFMDAGIRFDSDATVQAIKHGESITLEFGDGLSRTWTSRGKDRLFVEQNLTLDAPLDQKPTSKADEPVEYWKITGYYSATSSHVATTSYTKDEASAERVAAALRDSAGYHMVVERVTETLPY